MEFLDTTLKDAKLIVPFVSHDNRGAFIKDYHYSTFKENGINFEIKEEMCTYSKKGVLRGMHIQLGKPQAKLIRCAHGEVYDYIVDVRKDSPTYLKGEGFILNEENNNCLFVPKGFLHGYLVKEDSIVIYKCDEEFYKQGDASVKWNDPILNIDWQSQWNGDLVPILSEKDSNNISYEEFEKLN